MVGDLNICFINERQHKVLIEIEKFGFKQQIKLPTHTAGKQIDHVFYFSPSVVAPSLMVEQFGQFYTDHDMIIVKQPINQVILVQYNSLHSLNKII